MKFAVIQKEGDVRKIVAFIYSKAEFKECIGGIYCGYKFIDKTIEELKFDSDFDSGSYLIFSEKDETITLVEKIITKSIGYFYTSVENQLKIVYQWSLLPVDIYDDNFENLSLKRFDYKNIRLNYNICIIEPQGDKHKNVICEILNIFNKKKLNNCTIVTSDDDVVDFFAKRYPKISVYTNLSDELVHEIGKKEGVIIFYEYQFYKNKNRSALWEEIIFNGRCYKQHSIIYSNNVYTIPTSIRNNMDYAFVFDSKEGTLSIKRVYNAYIGKLKGFLKYKSFRHLIQKHKSLVFDNTSTNKDISGRLFRF